MIPDNYNNGFFQENPKPAKKNKKFFNFISHKKWTMSKAEDARGIFKRSTRRFSHYAIMFIFIMVLILGIFARPGKDENKNPYLFQKADEEVNQVTYAQSVATIAGIIDQKIGQQAYDIASKQETAPVLAMAGNSFVANPILSETRQSTDKPKNDIQWYIVKDGDTLSTIAGAYGLTTDTLRWANNINDPDSVKPGQKLVIPPTTGVLYTVKDGDTLDAIASQFSSTKAVIVAQNDLYGEDIKSGMMVMIPDGVGPAIVKPAPAPAPTTEYASSQDDNQSSQSAPQGTYYSGSSYNRFPYGWCTWYVASRRNVPWSGNAGDWYWNAASMGYSVGHAPAPGAIMVTAESGWGHVAYVESVNGNTFTVSEMNYNGWGVVDRRTVSAGSVPLIGFIY